MCIQDYYPYWHRKDRSASASKAMPIDASDASVHHIFFDDNIADTFARIVDVYDVATGTRQPELWTPAWLGRHASVPCGGCACCPTPHHA